MSIAGSGPRPGGRMVAGPDGAVYLIPAGGRRVARVPVPGMQPVPGALVPGTRAAGKKIGESLGDLPQMPGQLC